MYAVNGIGNFFALKGWVGDAQEIYRAIIDNKPDFVNAYVNLGHIASVTGDVAGAIMYFKKVLEKFFDGRNEEIELAIVRLYF